MLVIAATLAQAQALPPEPPADDVVVIGRRLKAWAGHITTTIGITTCRTTKSTGDREIDALGCTALRACWPTYRPQVEAAEEGNRPREERAASLAAAKAALGACLKPRFIALAADLADRRAAKART